MIRFHLEYVKSCYNFCSLVATAVLAFTMEAILKMEIILSDTNQISFAVIMFVLAIVALVTTAIFFVLLFEWRYHFNDKSRRRDGRRRKSRK